MKGIIGLLMLVSVFDSFRVFSQNEPSDNINTFWSKIKIRKAFESLDDKKDPAIVSASFPKDKRNSFLINGGISYQLITLRHRANNSVKQIFSPFFIFNRNTEIDKEQFNCKLGISFNWKLGNLNLATRTTRYFTWNNALEYMRDRIDSSHSLCITSNISQINSRAGRGSFYINTYKDIGKGFQYFVSWSAGFEYQNNFEVKDKAKEGGIFRGYYNTDLRLRKKTSAIGEPFAEIAINNTGRYDFINGTSNRENYLPLFKAEVILFPTLNEDFSLSFSYNTGADPLAGLAKQDFYLLGLKLKK